MRGFFAKISLIAATQMKLSIVQWLVSLLESPLWASDAVLVVGNNRGNKLTGDADSPNLLSGFAGNDIITGGTAADVLIGGAGSDTLTGGGGADRFVLDKFDASAADRIVDFTAAQGDRLVVDKSLFPGATATVAVVTSGGSRSVQASRLSAALRGSASFIYVPTTGEVWWNQNGAASGAGQGGVVAVLVNRPASLAATMIELI